ncbi:MAG: MGMT family protein [Planctomycetes bacterium]|nr:MGMT family protein [Planctomycetota bacterium]
MTRAARDAEERGWGRFYKVVARIPKGRVATYGEVAARAGNPRWARQVGFALAALAETDGETRVPWHRVLGARGKGLAGVSLRDSFGESIQRQLLEAEGVEFDARARVSLARFGWTRPSPRTSPAKLDSRQRGVLEVHVGPSRSPTPAKRGRR